jgi:hypothetical protein
MPTPSILRASGSDRGTGLSIPINLKQIGLASTCYSLDFKERFAYLHNWGQAWADDHVLNPAPFWMPPAFTPYLCTNRNRPRFVSLEKYSPSSGLFACPSGIRVKVPSTSADYGFAK